MTAAATAEPVQGEESLSDLVRSQARQIAQLLAALEAVMAARAVAPEVPSVPDKPAGPTFGELWTAYVDSLGERTWTGNMLSMMAPVVAWFAPSVVPAKPRYGRHPARPACLGPDMAAADVEPHHWTTFRTSMAGHSVTYRNHVLARLKAFFAWAVAERRLKAHPLLTAKPEKKKPRRETWIAEEQLQAVIAEDNRAEFVAYLLTAFDTGMRADEVRTLQWSQIDFLTGAVRLSWTTTKTSHTRTVYLSPRAKDAIKGIRKEHSRYVFAVRAQDKPLSSTWFWRHFRDAADRAGIKAAPGDGRLHFHDATRHSFGNRFLRRGGRLDQLRAAMGHADLKTTQLYLHTSQDDVQEGFDLLHGSERKPPHRT